MAKTVPDKDFQKGHIATLLSIRDYESEEEKRINAKEEFLARSGNGPFFSSALSPSPEKQFLNLILRERTVTWYIIVTSLRYPSNIPW